MFTFLSCQFFHQQERGGWYVLISESIEFLNIFHNFSEDPPNNYGSDYHYTEYIKEYVEYGNPGGGEYSEGGQHSGGGENSGGAEHLGGGEGLIDKITIS